MRLAPSGRDGVRLASPGRRPPGPQCLERLVGEAPPRTAEFMGRERAYHDGGGLCSPGRWPPKRRRLPELGQEAVMEGALLIMEADLKRNSKLNVEGFVLRMAAGRITKPPFSEEALEGVRRILNEFFEIPGSDQGIASGQCMRLGMMSYMLKAFGDPDFEFLKSLEEGVPLGLHGSMPRAPLIFDRKQGGPWTTQMATTRSTVTTISP